MARARALKVITSAWCHKIVLLSNLAGSAKFRPEVALVDQLNPATKLKFLSWTMKYLLWWRLALFNPLPIGPIPFWRNMRNIWSKGKKKKCECVRLEITPLVLCTEWRGELGRAYLLALSLSIEKDIIQSWVTQAPGHKLLGKIILSSPNRSRTYDLLHTDRMLYLWATGDMWELRLK